MTADELLHKFDVFRNSEVRPDRGQPPSFGRCRASGINFLQQLVSTCPGPILSRKLPDKRRELPFSLDMKL